MNKEKRSYKSLSLLFSVFIAVSIVGIINTFFFQPFKIPSLSMYPTYRVGDKILVNKLPDQKKLKAGDIIVFHPPTNAKKETCGADIGEEYLPGKTYTPHTIDKNTGLVKSQMACPLPAQFVASNYYVKRIVAVPGDTVEVIQGHAVVNGKTLNEDYITQDNTCINVKTVQTASGFNSCNFKDKITIPPGYYFVMGDNRNDGQSADSRYWGPVAQANVIGVVTTKYWPL